MRVLHVNKFLYRRGGAEAYMLDVAQRQQDAGAQVEFFGMRHPDNGRHRFEAHFPSHIEFGDLSRQRLPMQARAMGRMLWSPTAASGMAHVVDEWRPDVVHLHNIYHQLSPSVLRPLAARGIPAVMTLHDAKLACPTYLFMANGELCTACIPRRYWEAPRRRCAGGSLAASAAAAIETATHTATGAYGWVARFISPSEFHAGKMREARVFPDRLRVLANFVDATAPPAHRRAGGPVVAVARLAAEKGVDVLVRAAAIGGFPVEIAGDGPERDRLERLAHDVGVADRVRFLGRLAHSDVLRLLASASVVAVPSRCYENQPMTVLEAAGSAVPVVASDLGGLPEIVEHGRTGLLVRHDDPLELAESLTALRDDPVRSAVMGEAARARVRERNAPHIHLARLEELYREASETAATLTRRRRTRRRAD